jgi:hypothetical protein
VIDVLHSLVQVEVGARRPTEAIISNLYIRSVRDGKDGQVPCMMNFEGAAEGSSVWLQGLALQGDTFESRGVCSPACDISAEGMRLHRTVLAVLATYRDKNVRRACDIMVW